MKERRRIEREFGVRVAGEILDPSRWTRTALKRLPEDSPLNGEQTFGRSAPLIVDVGCGNGRYLIGSAVWRPQFDHLGIDLLPLVLRYATRRANRRGLSNIRFAACDGLTLVRKYLRPAGIRELHCYHPQPYHDPSEAHKRLLSPAFLALVHRCLEPEGVFFVQTDNAGYWHYLREVVPVFFEFALQGRPWSDAPKGRTRREIIALRRGLPVYRGWGKKRPGIVPETAMALAAQLPAPLFDAGPRDREIESLENE
jgi:tRNA (guanine-N7-)-methyltransferase